ncbi:MAG: hypothetical protein F4X11_04310 [Acidobacteria bacterium]|nr:hypothetical protein [Acidobacteriota bacterium]
MCAILDNSVVHEVFGDRRSPAGEAFFRWISVGGGRLIGGGRLLRELARNENFWFWWREAVLAGLATRLGDGTVEEETTRLVEREACQSNDEHVVALAVVGGARLLYSNDKKLQRDFKNRHLVNHPPGRVYSTRRSGAFTRKKRELLAGSSCRIAP